MNKRELVAVMAEKSCQTKKNCEAVLDAILETIGEALKSGDKVQIVGFGAFEVKDRMGRTGRNPRTNESMDIPARKQPSFRPGKALKEAVR